MDKFNKILFGTVKVATAGIVNISADKQKIVIKDPLTGTADMLKKGSDKLFRNKNEGVWIGNRPIEELGNKNTTFGFSSAALRVFNVDLMHQAVMVDGKVYSLSNDIGGDIQLKEVTSDYEKNKYEWRYRGKSQITTKFFEKMIQEVNLYHAKYNLAFANCQDVSDALSKYALGLYTQKQCLFYILPKIDSLGEAVLYGIFANTGIKAYTRLVTDINSIEKNFTEIEQEKITLEFMIFQEEQSLLSIIYGTLKRIKSRGSQFQMRNVSKTIKQELKQCWFRSKKMLDLNSVQKRDYEQINGIRYGFQIISIPFLMMNKNDLFLPTTILQPKKVQKALQKLNEGVWILKNLNKEFDNNNAAFCFSSAAKKQKNQPQIKKQKNKILLFQSIQVATLLTKIKKENHQKCNCQNNNMIKKGLGNLIRNINGGFLIVNKAIEEIGDNNATFSLLRNFNCSIKENIQIKIRRIETHFQDIIRSTEGCSAQCIVNTSIIKQEFGIKDPLKTRSEMIK
ncbi:hypothetical protein ABPG74_020566 [Tetrahymena malaccensis]